MNCEAPVFSQLMDFVPYHRFQQCVEKYQGNKWVQTFSCWEQFLAMSYAQLRNKESLRRLENSLSAHPNKLYHMGFRCPVKRATLAVANQNRDYRIYRDFAYSLIDLALPLYAGEVLGLELKNTVYALDSTTIDLCLSLFPWAVFRQTKAAVKLHTLLDLRSSIPVFMEITPGKVHDVNILDQIPLPPGSILVMDRAYLDFNRLYRLNLQAIFFVLRTKKNFRARRVYTHTVDKSTGLICDQTVALTGFYSKQNYPQYLRKVRYHDREKELKLEFLSNNFALPALTIAEIYRLRWQIELFFKWIKQHLKIKAFYGTTDNAVMTQIWIAISTYVLVALVKKRLNLTQDLYTILQILDETLTENIPILQALTKIPCKNHIFTDSNQLYLL
jgi:hypothetical protein